MTLGAMLGACYGAHAIPIDWIAKLGRGREVLALARQLVQIRADFGREEAQEISAVKDLSRSRL